MEKYIPYMSPEELHEYEQAVTTGRKPVFSPDTLVSLQRRASEREKELNAKFAAANAKSNELCKHPTAKNNKPFFSSPLPLEIRTSDKRQANIYGKIQYK